MSKTNHRRGSKSRKHQKHPWMGGKRHSKNPKLGARPLTGSVHEADYPPEGWNSRIRQRENAETKKLVADLEVNGA